MHGKACRRLLICLLFTQKRHDLEVKKLLDIFHGFNIFEWYRRFCHFLNNKYLVILLGNCCSWQENSIFIINDDDSSMKEILNSSTLNRIFPKSSTAKLIESYTVFFRRFPSIEWTILHIGNFKSRVTLNDLKFHLKDWKNIE